jgi:hypothetical protein
LRILGPSPAICPCFPRDRDTTLGGSSNLEASEDSMYQQRKLFALLILTTLSFVVWRLAGSVVAAAAVASPNATRIQVLRLAAHAPYTIAAPHQSLLRATKEFIEATVSACGGGSGCAYEEPKSACRNDCGFCGNCPNCMSGPCALYTCQTSTKNWNCKLNYNGTLGDPCYGCQRDTYNGTCSCGGPHEPVCP